MDTTKVIIWSSSIVLPSSRGDMDCMATLRWLVRVCQSAMKPTILLYIHSKIVNTCTLSTWYTKWNVLDAFRLTAFDFISSVVTNSWLSSFYRYVCTSTERKLWVLCYTSSGWVYLEYESSLFNNNLIVPSLPIIYNELINRYPQVFRIEHKSLFYQYFVYCWWIIFRIRHFVNWLFCLCSYSGLRHYSANHSFAIYQYQHDIVKSIIVYDESELNAIPSYGLNWLLKILY